MNRHIYLIAAALITLATACHKAETSFPGETHPVTYIKADSNEGFTKSSVSGTDASFTWNTGDSIAVYTTGGYKISDPLSSTYNGASSATFAFSGNNALNEEARTDFALFPASLVWDGTSILEGSAAEHSATSLKLTLPASYTLEQVQDEVSPTPMIALNQPGQDLSFKALSPLLRVTVVNIPKQTQRIDFDFNGQKVQGEFTLTSVTPGSTAIQSSATEGADDILSVTLAGNTTWHDSLVVNLPVPAGTYGDITVTAYDALSGGHVLLSLTTPIKTGDWSPTRKASRKLTATLPVFSLSSEKKVAFAPGNLIYTKRHLQDYYWRERFYFAAEQYHFVGTGGVPNYYSSANQLITGPYSLSEECMGNSSLGWSIDLFGWSRDGNVGINNSTDVGFYKYDFYDWGGVPIGDGFGINCDTFYPRNTWRTPTGGPDGEWKYLLEARPVSNHGLDNARCMLATITTSIEYVEGMIIFPDHYTHPADVNIGWGGNFPYSRSIASTADWDKMEAAGAVFLPAAGQRDGNKVNRDYGIGGYWSSTSLYDDEVFNHEPEVTSQSYILELGTEGSKGYNPAKKIVKYYGYSVRLVRDLN